MVDKGQLPNNVTYEKVFHLFMDRLQWQCGIHAFILRTYKQLHEENMINPAMLKFMKCHVYVATCFPRPITFCSNTSIRLIFELKANTVTKNIYYNHSKFSKWKLQESHRTNLIVFKQWCKQCCYSLDYKLLANAGTYTRTKGQECCIVIWIIQNKRALIEISCFFCSPKTVI